MSTNTVKSNKNKINCTACFKSIGVPSRMEIYAFLSKVKKATVTDIVDQLDLTQPTVSYHLKEMKKNSLLDSKREGKKIFYFLDDDCPHCSEDCVLSRIDFIKRGSLDE